MLSNPSNDKSVYRMHNSGKKLFYTVHNYELLNNRTYWFNGIYQAILFNNCKPLLARRPRWANVPDKSVSISDLPNNVHHFSPVCFLDNTYIQEIARLYNELGITGFNKEYIRRYVEEWKNIILDNHNI